MTKPKEQKIFCNICEKYTTTSRATLILNENKVLYVRKRKKKSWTVLQ